MKGKFVVIEGLEGAGKSTAMSICEKFFEAQNIPLMCTREPGGTPVAEALREIVKGDWSERITNETELLIMYAARQQLVENLIKPTLAQGTWVLGDRHDMSTQAYQGGGRQIPQSVIQPIKQVTMGNFKPDHTLYLDVEPEEGLRRARGRGELDRIEMSGLAFFQRCRQKYLELAEQDDSVIVIDAMQPVDKVLNAIMCALRGIVNA